MIGTECVKVAALKSGVDAMILPAGSTNPLIPVFADRIRARRFSIARNTAMEKCW